MSCLVVGKDSIRFSLTIDKPISTLTKKIEVKRLNVFPKIFKKIPSLELDTVGELSDGGVMGIFLMEGGRTFLPWMVPILEVRTHKCAPHHWRSCPETLTM